MAKDNTPKTNAARLLDKAKIDYKLITYPVDPDNLDAIHVANALGQDIEKVFKTLILNSDKGHFVCIIPGNKEVDLKKAAKVMGAKKAEMIAVKELLPLTGYIRGGCSPIAMKKKFPTYIHSSANDKDTIYISAGVRGMQIQINPKSLISFVNASVADIIKDNLTLEEHG